MEEHVTVVGIVRVGLGILGVIGALILAVILTGSGVAAWYSGEEEALPILVAVAVSIGLVILFFSVPGIIGGVGVLKHKNWARYLVLVLSVFGLLSFPIGTILGAYSIWVLTNKRTISMFTPAVVRMAPEDEVA